MKILLISSYLPHPLHSGGDVRLYNLLIRLKKKHQVTLVCEKRSFQTEDDLNAVKRICEDVITIPRRKQWSLKNVVGSLLSQRSFLITGHTLPEMREILGALLTEKKFELIHVETSYVMQNIPETTLPIVLTEHNVEYLVYQRYSDAGPFFLRPFLSYDVQKLKKDEISFWKKATRVVAVSEKEKSVMEEVGIHPSVVPNGVDTTLFSLKNAHEAFRRKEKRVVFIGDFRWIQNQNSARWILSDIWPKIEKATDSTVKLWIIGRNMPDDIKKHASERIIIEGPSQKPAYELFAESFILLAPLKVAGGTQYKILEAMAVGTPTVTTPLGVEGLMMNGKTHVLVGKTETELSNHVVDLLTDEKKYQQLAIEGRGHIEKHFSFDAIAKTLERVYEEVHDAKN